MLMQVSLEARGETERQPLHRATSQEMTPGPTGISCYTVVVLREEGTTTPGLRC